MIHFDRFVLDNGLKVIVHEDHSTPMAVVNVMYDVGARDEDPDKTGFAHLFEHLMFGGSINIPDYDEPLQMAGEENNAYTTNDLTNYYIQLPAENLETAFWLESDRMLSLAFEDKSLDVQRKVVCEEFKEHYINKPYGDVWHKLRDLSYKQHPYRWTVMIRITDGMGKMVQQHSKKVNGSSSIRLETSELANGTYLVIMYYNGEQYFQKVMVAK
jgi:predicted Zn-dependent peptidase